MNYSLTDLVTALSGGSSFRTKALPEAKDFDTWLASAYTPSQTSIMSSLIDPVKDALIAKSLTDRALLKSKNYG